MKKLLLLIALFPALAFGQLNMKFNKLSANQFKLKDTIVNHIEGDSLPDFKWVRANSGGGGSMIYPGAGIAVSTGSAWDVSIANNSGNWNTSYGWGNHASAGYVPQTRTITINGASYDLSANRSWTVSGGVKSSPLLASQGDTTLVPYVGNSAPFGALFNYQASSSNYPYLSSGTKYYAFNNTILAAPVFSALQFGEVYNSTLSPTAFYINRNSTVLVGFNPSITNGAGAGSAFNLITYNTITNTAIDLLRVGNGLVNKFIINKDGNTYAPRINAAIGGDSAVLNPNTGLKLYGGAKVWNDVAIGELKFPATGSTIPVFTTGFRGSALLGAFYFQGTVANDICFFDLQIPHNVSPNDSVRIHWHGSPTTTPAATDSIVLQFNYTYAEIGSVYPVVTSVRNVISLNGRSQWGHYLDNVFISATGSGLGISGTYNCSIVRLQDDASDTYTSNYAFFSIDAHAKIESLGSNQYNAK